MAIAGKNYPATTGKPYPATTFKPYPVLPQAAPKKAAPNLFGGAKVAVPKKATPKRATPTPTSSATQAPPPAASPRSITPQPLYNGALTIPSLITPPAKRKAADAGSTAGASADSMPGTTAPDYTGLLTPSQLAAEAAKMVTANQLPATQQLNSESAQSAAAALAAAQTTQGYYKALAGILQNIAPGVQAGYDTAAANDSAFAKGFSDGLSHVQSQTQGEASDVLGVSGGGVQAGQVAGQIGGKSATDALYSLGGYLPASTLEAQGAAAGAAARQLPFTATGQGADAIKGINAQQVLDQKAIHQKLDDLKAQVPGLATTMTHQLTTENLSKKQQADLQASRTDTLNLQRWTAKKNAEAKTTALKIQSIIATGIDPDTGKLTPHAQAELDRALQGQARVDQGASRTAAEWTRTNHYLSNADGSPVLGSGGHPIPQVGYKLNAAGTIVKAPTVSAPKTMSESQWSTAYGKINSAIDGFYHGVTELTNSAGEVTRPQQDAITYQDAFTRIKMQYPRLTEKKVYDMLNIYYQPGQGGRLLYDPTNPNTLGPPAPKR